MESGSWAVNEAEGVFKGSNATVFEAGLQALAGEVSALQARAAAEGRRTTAVWASTPLRLDNGGWADEHTPPYLTAMYNQAARVSGILQPGGPFLLVDQYRLSWGARRCPRCAPHPLPYPASQQDSSACAPTASLSPTQAPILVHACASPAAGCMVEWCSLDGAHLRPAPTRWVAHAILHAFSADQQEHAPRAL